MMLMKMRTMMMKMRSMVMKMRSMMMMWMMMKIPGCRASRSSNFDLP